VLEGACKEDEMWRGKTLSMKEVCLRKLECAHLTAIDRTKGRCTSRGGTEKRGRVISVVAVVVMELLLFLPQGAREKRGHVREVGKGGFCSR